MELVLELDLNKLNCNAAEKLDYSWWFVGLGRDTLEQGDQGYLGTFQVEPTENQKQLQRRKLLNLLWEHFKDQVEPGELDSESHSTIQLDWGWKEVVGKWIIPSNMLKEDQIEPVNLSEVFTEGAPKWGIHERKRTLAQSSACGRLDRNCFRPSWKKINDSKR